jgi:CRP-like cAMP-binding protein
MRASAALAVSPDNHLLAALAGEELGRLVPALEHVAFSLGDVIYEPGARLDHLYFPSSCIVSLVYTMRDGVTAEMGLVGNEGAVGIALLTGGETMPNRAVVQVAGDAFRINARTVLQEFRRGGPLQRSLLLYTQALLTQTCQTAVCNRLHSVEERLCRWILLCHDRLKSNELLMTQEYIANMLGGRRQSVTVAAGRLQDAGLIHYSRGHIRILDRPGLEAAVCECYAVVKTEFDRLLGRAGAWRQVSIGGLRGAARSGPSTD